MSAEENAGCDKCGVNDRWEDAKVCVPCMYDEHGVMFDALMEVCNISSHICCNMTDGEHEDYCLFNISNEALKEIK